MDSGERGAFRILGHNFRLASYSGQASIRFPLRSNYSGCFLQKIGAHPSKAAALSGKKGGLDIIIEVLLWLEGRCLFHNPKRTWYDDIAGRVIYYVLSNTFKIIHKVKRMEDNYDTESVIGSHSDPGVNAGSGELSYRTGGLGG
jgi:hypothetical protein